MSSSRSCLTLKFRNSVLGLLVLHLLRIKHKENCLKNNSKQAYQMSNKKQQSAENNITCYKCKQAGHYRNQCPLLKIKQSNAFSAVFLNGSYDKNEWYVDSGASSHFTANQHWIENVNNARGMLEIIIANETKIPVVCSGDVKIVSGYNYDITVKNVLCVPNITTNLLSVSALIKSGNHVSFEANHCYIRNQNNDLVARADLVNGVYKLVLKQCSLWAATAQLWQRRLAHINSCDLNKMRNGVVNGVNYSSANDIKKSSCVICCEGKQTRLPFPSKVHKGDDVLQIVHADLCGPMETKSIGGARYILLFVDDYSRMTFIYFLKEKCEAFEMFKAFKAMVENQQNKKIKIFRTDNGGEFWNKSFDKLLVAEGILYFIKQLAPILPNKMGFAKGLTE